MTDGKVTDNGGDVHTPQIWEWTRQDGEFTALVWRHPEGGGGYILEPEISDDAESAGEVGIFVSEDHARLIAAAPTLLDIAEKDAARFSLILEKLAGWNGMTGNNRAAFRNWIWHCECETRAAIAKATGQ